MEWQNYNHLFYFYLVATEGGISRAAEKMRLSQSTISFQIKCLEKNIGEKLFEKVGRNIRLTESGKIALKYCEEIFLLGKEMKETLRGKPSGRNLNLIVGITNSLPKLIAHQLIEPAFRKIEFLYLVSKEDHFNNLIDSLIKHEIDLVLSEIPLPPNFPMKAFNHLLGECGVSFFCSKKIRKNYSSKFPKCLHQAPFLLPGKMNLLRKNLEQWFEEKKIYPQFTAEFDDSALMKVFGQSSKGFFAAPSVLEREIINQYDLVLVGKTKEINEKFYAITMDRKIKHPGVLAITESAREKLF